MRLGIPMRRSLLAAVMVLASAAPRAVIGEPPDPSVAALLREAAEADEKALVDLGYYAAGPNYARAEANALRAVELRTRVQGATHSDVGASLYSLAEARAHLAAARVGDRIVLGRARPDDRRSPVWLIPACATLRRASAMLAAGTPSQVVMAADALVDVANVLERLGATRRASELLARATRLVPPQSSSHLVATRPMRQLWSDAFSLLLRMDPGPRMDGRAFVLPPDRAGLLSDARRVLDDQLTQRSGYADADRVLSNARGLVAMASAEDPAMLERESGLLSEELASFEARLAKLAKPDDVDNRGTVDALVRTVDLIEERLVACRVAAGDLDGARTVGDRAHALRVKYGRPARSTSREAFEAAIAKDGEAIRAVQGFLGIPPNDAKDLAARDAALEALCIHADGWRAPAVGLAVRVATEGIEARRRLFGADSAEEGDGYASLGLVLAASGRWKDAEVAWRTCIRIRKLHHTAIPVPEQHAHAALAVVLAAAGRFAEAKDEMLAARGRTGDADPVEYVRRRVNAAILALEAGDSSSADAEIAPLPDYINGGWTHTPSNAPLLDLSGGTPPRFRADSLLGVCRRLGRLQDERTLRAIIPSKLYDDDPVASALATAEGDFGAAVALERAAFVAARRRLGDDAALIDRRADLGAALLHDGRLEEAVAWLSEVAARIEAGDIAVGDSRRNVLDVLLQTWVHLAQALAQRGAVTAAIPYAEAAMSALAVYDDVAPDPPVPTLPGALERLDVDALVRYVGPRRPPDDLPVIETYAELLAAAGSPQKAVRELEAARDLLAGALPDRHPRVGRLLRALAETRVAGGDAAGAVPDARRAAEIAEAAYGAEHPALAEHLATLGDALLLSGDLATADTTYARALAIAEASLGRTHVLVPRTLAGISLCRVRQGRASEAVETMRRAVGCVDERVRAAFAGSSLAERMTLLGSIQWVLADWVEVCMAAGIDGYAEVLRLKGLAGRALQQDARLLRDVPAADRPAYRALTAAQRRLARLLAESPDRGWRRVPWRTEMAAVAAEVDRRSEALRAKLSSTSHGYDIEDLGVAAVVARLRAGEALVDVLLAGGRYSAWVLDVARPVAHVDLGPADVVDGACEALRAEFRDAVRDDAPSLRAAREQFDKVVMAPLLAAIPVGVRTTYLVPDGALAAVPMESGGPGASDDGRSRRPRFVQLSAAQDLAAPDRKEPTRSRAVLIGNLDYDHVHRPEAPVVTGEIALANRVVGASRFLPLPSTASEIDGVATLVASRWRGGTAVQIEEDRARESSLAEAVRSTRIVHFSTHGFVRPSLTAGLRAPADPEDRLGPGLERHVRGVDPLLVSGLALSGANVRSREDDDDGVLTALEASSLDLTGTDLVFLAACDTARGVEQAGDGITGLVRAFRSAGARQVVATLWPVDDDATKALVLAFYDRYLGPSGGDASTAMADAVASLRKDPRFKAPSHGAAFVVYGRR